MMDLEKLAYSFDGAAAATDTSRHFWRKLAKQKKVQVCRVGRRVLIPASELRRITTAGAVLKVPTAKRGPKSF